MNDTITLIVDQYRRHVEAVERDRKIDPSYEAEELSRLIKPLGRDRRCIALVSEDDAEGLISYRRSSYEIISMDGDRKDTLRRFIRRMNDTLSRDPPDHLVVVTTDEDFQFLFDTALRNRRTNLAVWAPRATVPSTFTDPDYNYRPLEDLLRDIKVKRLDIRLDYENLHFGLEERGWSSEPKTLIEAAKAAVPNLGEVVNIVAYADWDVLSKSANRNIQRELAHIGVETRYQISLRGKNSADMKLADDIRTLLERNSYEPDAVDVIILGTCDRDFRPTVETAKARGKRLVILSLKDGISHELRRVAGDDVRYLDDHLKPPSGAQRHFSVPKPWDEHAGLVMEIALWLRHRGWKWAYVDKLAEALALDLQDERLEQAVADGVLIRRTNGVQGKSEALMPNRNHPLVQTIQHLIRWVPRRIDYCVNEKGMSYVDSHFLAQGMTMDERFTRLGVGQNRREAEGWLDLIADAGLIVKKPQPHPKTPTKIINTWWLLERHSDQELMGEATQSKEAGAIDQVSMAQVENREVDSAADQAMSSKQATPADETKSATNKSRQMPDWQSLMLTAAA